MCSGFINVSVCAAPPSLPMCLWEGDTDAGGNVQLSCVVAEGFPTPQVIWEKLEPDMLTLPVNMDGKKRFIQRYKTHQACKNDFSYLYLLQVTRRARCTSLMCLHRPLASTAAPWPTRWEPSTATLICLSTHVSLSVLQVWNDREWVNYIVFFLCVNF